MAQTNGSTTPSNFPLQPSQVPAQIDQLISLHLHLWPALTIAIQNAWGTSSPQLSADKRAWLAGAVSDLFTQKQLRDVEDLEEVLDHVMIDEFGVGVEDESVEEVARKIWKGVQRVRGGDGSEVQELMQVWEKKRGKKIDAVAGHGEDDDEDDEDDDESDDGAEVWNGFQDGQNADVDMDEAPMLVDSSRPKKQEPEVDEDGFTKVVGKKKR